MKYVAYYRVSTKKQSLGLEAQKTSVINFICQDSTNTLIAEFSERESGKNDHREELQKAIECCKKNNATLVIAKLDRLSRKVSFIFSLKDADINFIALDVPTFSTLTLGIYATLAQTEREMISLRTKNALAELKNKGVKLGNPNATFTDEMRAKADERKRAIAQSNTNNVRATFVIKELLKTTNNYSEIARYLNNNGFTTSRGLLFKAQQVKNLIARM
jgi:DNA invertase Pin-like site-specific DNA recombinase